MKNVQTQAAKLLAELSELPPSQRAGMLDGAGPADRVIVALGDEAERMVSADLKRALGSTDVVVELADERAGSLGRARARRARAYALCYAGRFEEALCVAGEAIELAEEAGHHVEAARARLGSMQALGELGLLDEAIDAGEAARAAFIEAGDEGLAGRADINLGIVHQRRDDQSRAVSCFERARPLVGNEPGLLGYVENGRGEALLSLNRFEEAGDAFGAALAAFEQARADLMAAIAEGNLAELAARQGRLQKTLFHFERARRRLETDASRGNLARLMAEQAEAIAVLGLPADALAQYRRALHELDACGLAMPAARRRAGMGHVLLRLGRRAEAETSLAAAAKAFDELGHATSRARVDLVRAELAATNGRPGEARGMALAALAHLHDRPVDAAAARLLLGRIAMDEGDLGAAEVELAGSIHLARQLELAPLLADVLLVRSRLRRQRGDLDGAVEDLNDATAATERVRDTLQAQRFRASFLGDRVSLYEHLLTALLDQQRPDSVPRAFGVAERARSRSLLEMMSGHVELEPPSSAAGDEGALMEQYTRVRGELSALYSRLADEGGGRPGQRSTAGWHRAVAALEEKLEDLESRLATTHGVGSLYAPSVTLEEVQALVPEDGALIEYVAAGDELLAFVVDRDSATVARHLATPAGMADLVRRFQFQINRALRPGGLKGHRGDRLCTDVRRELETLRARLIEPLAGRIAGRRRLIIAPHGSLHVLPFHALWDGQRYLVERFELATVPSSGILSQLARRIPPTRPIRPLVVGVPDAFAPQISMETEAVARALDAAAGEVLVNDVAGADRVVESARGASVIHLACHGRYSAASPMASGLKLADRWLTVRDIFAMNLRADLVTLSGCETGISNVQAGDELVGLIRGFLAAGAAALLVSLWRVDDRIACDMMPPFYETWTSGRGSVAAALRQTQIELLREHAHPAFWAPFSLVGKP